MVSESSYAHSSPKQSAVSSQQSAVSSQQSAVSSQQFSLTTPKFTVKDLILPDSTLNSIHDFLSYQKHAEHIFNTWGLATTHAHQRQIAINLYGLPGTGKTMASHAIAHELGKPLIAVNYAEIESKYVGETSKNITALFNTAKEQNAIIFFDEADAILSRRVTNMSHATDVSVNQTRSVLLTLMNDHEGLIIFTTNFIENYDPAFMRRILSHILFELPDLGNRQKLWQKYIPTALPLAPDVNFEILAEHSDGLSGSDISNCVLKSALSASRSGDNSVSLSHFTKAIDEIKTSQKANQFSQITTKQVSEEYVKTQLGEKTFNQVKNKE
ncbi:ATP-binding protein [Moraxella sp. K2450]|nr:ATP-binding protein [Moraxella sp. K2450]